MARKWTDTEDAQLRELRAAGLDSGAIADEIGRTFDSVQSRCQRLRLPITTAPMANATTRQAQHRDLRKELESANRRAELAVAELEGIRKRRAFRLGKPASGKKRGGFCRVTWGDSHGMRVDKAAFAAFVHDLKIINPAEAICMGDALDCDGFLTSHRAIGYVSLSEYSYAEDVDAANEQWDQIGKAAPTARHDYIEGNHECLTDDHEVLTGSGWLPIAEVTTDTPVAMLNREGVVEWAKPTVTHSYDYRGPMVEIDSEKLSAKMTPNHRVLYYKQKSDEIGERKAETLLGHSNSKWSIPTCGQTDNAENTEVSDDEIRLAAWIITDGYISKHCGIAQSKPEHIETIGKLLDRLGIDYRVKRRHRNIDSIGGVMLKTTREQVEFVFRAESNRRLGRLFGIEWNCHYMAGKPIPDWAWRLSARQFEIFVETLIDGDGSRVAGAYCLYGERFRLSELQSLFVVHGYRCSLIERNRGGKADYWVLNITRRRSAEADARTVHESHHDGKVYCLTTPEENFFVRRNGLVHVTGNSRVYSWIRENCENDADKRFHEARYLPSAVLSLEARGVTYHARLANHDGLHKRGTIKRGKCLFVHGDSHAKNAAERHVMRAAANVVFGHTHRTEQFVTSMESTGVVAAWNPGCLCERHPMWKHSEASTWSHGYGLQFVGADGDFLHVNVPIIAGRSFLGPMLRILKA